MKATYDKQYATVTVVLSERNLITLLAQLRDETRPAPALVRQGDLGLDEPTIVVQAELDGAHYADRTGTIHEPIAMRPQTEELMDEIRKELDEEKVEAHKRTKRKEK